MARRLLFPPDNSSKPLRLHLGLRSTPLPPWPWQATMLTAINCYLLWAITWIQFVILIAFFSYRGLNLWYYSVSGKLFGFTIPELFLVFSVALSVFAVCAVAGSTYRIPKLWKRLFAVSLFAGFAIGISCLSLHLRHYTYICAITSHDEAFQIYHGHLKSNYNFNDESVIQQLEWERNRVENYDLMLRQYQDKYELPK